MNKIRPPSIFGFCFALSVLCRTCRFHCDVWGKDVFTTRGRGILVFMPIITICPPLGFLHKQRKLDFCAILVSELRHPRYNEVFLWLYLLRMQRNNSVEEWGNIQITACKVQTIDWCPARQNIQLERKMGKYTTGKNKLKRA